MILSYDDFLKDETSYGLHGLDLKLKSYLDFQGGFFIDVGANDGINQNNTKIFEDLYGWTGILIEPSKESFNLCRTNRPKTSAFNCALVANNDTAWVMGDFDGHLMSSINAQRRHHHNEILKVPARTITSILEECNIDNIDFFNLDVEGYELEVIKGLDLNRWRPKYFLIEVYEKDKENIKLYLDKYNYVIVENLSDWNYENNPNWDGTHNDYLFKYNG